MPLLNYTTDVSPQKSVMELQQILAKAGARQVLVEYGMDGNPTAVAFLADTEYGPRHFVLPADPKKTYAAMQKTRVPPRFMNMAQATKVSWRILKDWAEAQMALIETGMASVDQVMLPYMRDAEGGRTVYEIYKDQQMALPSGKSDAKA